MSSEDVDFVPEYQAEVAARGGKNSIVYVAFQKNELVYGILKARTHNGGISTDEGAAYLGRNVTPQAFIRLLNDWETTDPFVERNRADLILLGKRIGINGQRNAIPDLDGRELDVLVIKEENRQPNRKTLELLTAANS